MYQQTFLTENDSLGIVDPLLNAPCIGSSGNAVEGFADTHRMHWSSQPNTAPNPAASQPFVPLLRLLRSHATLAFLGGQLCIVEQHSVSFPRPHQRQGIGAVRSGHDHQGNWSFNLGIRGDLYNGLSAATARRSRGWRGVQHQAEQYGLRLPYARSWRRRSTRTSIIATTGCNLDVIAGVVPCVPAIFPRDSGMNFTPAAAGVWKIPGGGRRIFLEVHAQCV